MFESASRMKTRLYKLGASAIKFNRDKIWI